MFAQPANIPNGRNDAGIRPRTLSCCFHFQLDRLDAAKLKQLAARLPENKCCFCGESFRGWGNNPSPVMEREGAVACGECNIAIVRPQRFRIQ